MHALKSAPLRSQHESIRKHIGAIKKKLDPLLIAHNADAIRTLVTQLLGELGKHLQQEAKDLYPMLADSSDEATKATAAQYALEMQQKLPEVAEFNRRWPSADAIRNNGAAFIKEGEPLLMWLERRLISEGAELYPLLDKQDVAHMAIANNPDLKISRI